MAQWSVCVVFSYCTPVGYTYGHRYYFGMRNWNAYSSLHSNPTHRTYITAHQIAFACTEYHSRALSIIPDHWVSFPNFEYHSRALSIMPAYWVPFPRNQTLLSQPQVNDISRHARTSYVDPSSISVDCETDSFDKSCRRQIKKHPARCLTRLGTHTSRKMREYC